MAATTKTNPKTVVDTAAKALEDFSSRARPLPSRVMRRSSMPSASSTSRPFPASTPSFPASTS